MYNQNSGVQCVDNGLTALERPYLTRFQICGLGSNRIPARSVSENKASECWKFLLEERGQHAEKGRQLNKHSVSTSPARKVSRYVSFFI